MAAFPWPPHVREVWCFFVKPREGHLSARPVPRDHNDPGAHLRKPFRGNLANPRGATGNDHRLALHRNSPYRLRRQAIAGSKNQLGDIFRSDGQKRD